MNTGRFFKLLATLGMILSTYPLASMVFHNINPISLMGLSNMMLIIPIVILSLSCWVIGVVLCLLGEQKEILQQILEQISKEKPFLINKK